MFLNKLEKRNLIKPPLWLCDNTHYLTIMGSHAYAVADTSVRNALPDYDYYGFCIPPKEFIFPHLRDEIPGFGTPGPKFEQFLADHVEDVDAKKLYDIQVFNIVKYFELCRGCNPNMIDSLFAPYDCINHITSIGQIVLDNRKLFLSKLAYHRFRGYAFAQLKKATTKEPVGKRKEIVEKWGYDIKFCYHIVRLLDECEQILETGDLDIRRCCEVLKSVRRGEWTFDEIQEHLKQKDKSLEELYQKSELPYSADESKLRELLFNCLEEHYGNLKDVRVDQDWSINTLKEIDLILAKNRGKLY